MNAALSTVDMSHQVTDPSSLVELSSCSLVDSSSRLFLEHCILIEFTTVATQTGHMKIYPFLIHYFQKPQCRYTHASRDIHTQTHLDDDFNIHRMNDHL